VLFFLPVADLDRHIVGPVVVAEGDVSQHRLHVRVVQLEAWGMGAQWGMVDLYGIWLVYLGLR